MFSARVQVPYNGSKASAFPQFTALLCWLTGPWNLEKMKKAKKLLLIFLTLTVEWSVKAVNGKSGSMKYRSKKHELFCYLYAQIKFSTA